MKRKLCCACDTAMKQHPHLGAVKYFCERCQDFTPFQDLEASAYCPDCQQPMSISASCGCESFFCPACKSAKSSKKVVWKPA